MKDFKIILVIIFLCGLQLFSSTKKTPVINVVAINSETGEFLKDFTTTINKITREEKKDEPFIFEIKIEKEGYNPLQTIIIVEPKMAGKVVISTQRLLPFKTVKIESVTQSNYTSFITSQSDKEQSIKIISNSNTNTLQLVQSFQTNLNNMTANIAQQTQKQLVQIISNEFMTNIVQLTQTQEVDTTGLTQQYLKVEKTKQKIKKKKLTPFQRFVKDDFYLKGKKTLIIKDKSLVFKDNQGIKLKNGARLILENVSLIPKKDIWKGISLEYGAILIIKNCRISSAESAISLKNNSILTMSNCTITNCMEGIISENSKIYIKKNRIIKNRISSKIISSFFKSEKSLTEDNTYAPQFISSEIFLTNCLFNANNSAIYLLSGKFLIKNIIVKRSSDSGIILEDGSAFFENCLISSNSKDGVFCNEDIKIEPVFKRCDFIKNNFYAVRNAGRLEECFVYGNNGSDVVDTTPDKGSDDNIRDSYSNLSVIQIFKVDQIRAMSLKNNFKEE